MNGAGTGGSPGARGLLGQGRGAAAPELHGTPSCCACGGNPTTLKRSKARQSSGPCSPSQPRAGAQQRRIRPPPGSEHPSSVSVGAPWCPRGRNPSKSGANPCAKPLTASQERSSRVSPREGVAGTRGGAGGAFPPGWGCSEDHGPARRALGPSSCSGPSAFSRGAGIQHQPLGGKDGQRV